uniref:Uncharacterized protein n=1 Tax=Tanacetum cinerariifolium TaxID=118510 RepID=A0A6L2NGD8_TANCI|nr:hypothetical protein [Tanacetum cinerariifolium]
MMAPGGSFMTSFEDIKSFLSMHTPSNDWIRTYSKKMVCLHRREERNYMRIVFVQLGSTLALRGFMRAQKKKRMEEEAAGGATISEYWLCEFTNKETGVAISPKNVFFIVAGKEELTDPVQLAFHGYAPNYKTKSMISCYTSTAILARPHRAHGSAGLPAVVEIIPFPEWDGPNVVLAKPTSWVSGREKRTWGLGSGRSFPVIHQAPQETSVEILHDQENVIHYVQTFLRKFNRYSFFETPKVLLLAWDSVSKIKNAFGNKQYKPEDIQELFRKLFNDVQNIHEDLVEYINTSSWNRPSFYNNDEDDDEDYTIVMTPDFSIADSLSMGDKHLSTILETKSDEFIKYSVENLVPNVSEYEDLSDIESECDVPVCDNFITFSNSLFDADDNFSSSDDESFSDEDVPNEIYSNPLFDEEIMSIKIDPHHFNAEPALIESLLNQDSLIFLLLRSIIFSRSSSKLLYDNSSPRSLEEPNSENSDVIIESFFPSPILVEDSDSFIEDIDSFLTPDDSMPPDDDEIKPDTGVLTVKVMGDISEHYVLMPRLLPTQPTLASNEEKSPHLLSHRGFKAFLLSSESPMMIYGDDDEDYTIAITPNFLITDSLSMGDEHLSTIPETKSDEFIKSSVENLVLNPSESEDLSDIKTECDVPVYDNFTTFSNSLFDADDNFSSSDDESFSDEDVPKEIYSNPLFDEEIISIKIDPHHFNAESDLIEYLLNQDSSILSSPKIDSLLEEFSGELAHINLFPPGINEADFDPEEEIRLVGKLWYDKSSPRPPEEPNSKNYDVTIESFSPSPIPVEDSDSLMEEIDLFLTLDDSMPSDDDEIEPDTGVLTVKVMGDNSKHYVLMPRLLPTQPTLASNEEKYPHLLSHRGFKAFQLSSESPKMIYGGNIPNLDVSFLHFYPP